MADGPPRDEVKPFSIRLSQSTDRFVEAEARRTKRSKGAIVEALTEEAARCAASPESASAARSRSVRRG